LDLRNDGGGREDTMKEMAGHFLPEPTQIGVAISRRKKEDIIA
jgi:C-terminal processing protease CtpA/Prc